MVYNEHISCSTGNTYTSVPVEYGLAGSKVEYMAHVLVHFQLVHLRLPWRLNVDGVNWGIYYTGHTWHFPDGGVKQAVHIWQILTGHTFLSPEIAGMLTGVNHKSMRVPDGKGNSRSWTWRVLKLCEVIFWPLLWAVAHHKLNNNIILFIRWWPWWRCAVQYSNLDTGPQM